jgi:hypothetical protein
MPFTEGKMGVLMVEGTWTMNLLINPGFENDKTGWVSSPAITGLHLWEVVTSSKWQGNKALRLTGTGTHVWRGVCQIINSPAVGSTYTASVMAKCDPGVTYGVHVRIRKSTDGGASWSVPAGSDAGTKNTDWTRISVSYTVESGVNAILMEFYSSTGNQPGMNVYVDGCQFEQKPYAADPAMIAVRSNLPPAEFGVGIAFKPWWDSETYDLLDYRTIFVMGADASNNAVRVMRYPGGYWDLRIFAGGVGAYHRIERSFNAGEIMGFYLEKRGDQGKVYYVQENGESFESDWFTVGALFTSDDIKRMYLGTHSDGASRWAGGIIADYVFQTLLDGIDPIGYLSQIGKPKVTAVVGEEVESIPGSQLRDGLFREIPRVFSKPVAVSIAPGVFYQEVDLGNWAAGLRVYASEDMVMFIAGREIEIPKSVLLYLPWKVRTFEVRQKSAAAVGTLYIYGGC